MRFLAGNTVIILSLCQLKMRILSCALHSVLATKYNQASKTQCQIWSCSTVKIAGRVPPGGDEQRAVSKATFSYIQHLLNVTNKVTLKTSNQKSN